MFDGPRVDHTYDPMRKQGAILLGNGGDNSVGSQGTFYEGAMTAAGTFPSDATDQLVQANVVAASYDVPRLALAPAFAEAPAGRPASATAAPPGLQTFSPGSSQDTTVTFTNTSGAPATGVTLSISAPRQWTSLVPGTARTSETIAGPVPPGAGVSATFKVTAGPAAFNGDLLGRASWKNATTGIAQSDTTAQKVRNVSPVTINEFRVSAGSPANPTDSFIELYNAGSKPVDISGWTLTQHPTQQPIFSSVKIPAGTRLAAGGFHLLGLSNSGLVVPAKTGDKTIYVRSTAGMNVGGTITIDAGSVAETRTIASLGTAAGNATTLWQPLPDGPVVTIPVGSTNVPVTSVAGFAVGEKIALGYGAAFPNVARTVEKYEVATITAVGKPGTQAWLGVDAAAGATNIKVTSVANISAGDTIRLDIDSVGYGIETVTVTKVGTQASKVQLSVNAIAGATSIIVRGRGNVTGFVVGDKMTIGNPANHETVTITAVGASGPNGTTVEFQAGPRPGASGARGCGRPRHRPRPGRPAQVQACGEHALQRPRNRDHVPRRRRPFAHSSNEPVQPLGTGITLDKPLVRAHAIDAVMRDAGVTTAGYQGTPPPRQWFGGPALSPSAGTMVLRDAAGLVVDSLNYGLLVDPWASEGYQAKSGAGESGCRVPSPGAGRGGFGGFGGPGAHSVTTPHRSAGRFPDGLDTDSNCNDFLLQPASTLSAASAAGAANIKVSSVADFVAGQTLQIDAGAALETAVIAAVGTAGATTIGAATGAGATVIPVAGGMGFTAGQAITIDSGANQETAVVASIGRVFGPGGPGAPGGGVTITIAEPLKSAHAAGAQVSGTGISLTAALTRAHDSGAQIAVSVPTPGAPNRYDRRPR